MIKSEAKYCTTVYTHSIFPSTNYNKALDVGHFAYIRKVEESKHRPRFSSEKRGLSHLYAVR